MFLMRPRVHPFPLVKPVLWCAPGGDPGQGDGCQAIKFGISYLSTQVLLSQLFQDEKLEPGCKSERPCNTKGTEVHVYIGLIKEQEWLDAPLKSVAKRVMYIEIIIIRRPQVICQYLHMVWHQSV